MLPRLLLSQNAAQALTLTHTFLTKVDVAPHGCQNPLSVRSTNSASQRTTTERKMKGKCAEHCEIRIGITEQARC